MDKVRLLYLNAQVRKNRTLSNHTLSIYAFGQCTVSYLDKGRLPYLNAQVSKNRTLSNRTLSIYMRHLDNVRSAIWTKYGQKGQLPYLPYLYHPSHLHWKTVLCPWTIFSKINGPNNWLKECLWMINSKNLKICSFSWASFGLKYPKDGYNR